MTSSSQPARHSRLQFSLRLLLLAITLFALGFPLWYRWPFQDEEIRYYLTNGQPDKSRIQARIVTTWQRQWGKGKQRQGTSTVWRTSGNAQITEHYQNDIRTGPFVFRSDDYDVEGQYLDGQKHGTWLTTKSGKILRRDTYDHGVPHGLVFETSDTGRTYEFRVEHGQLDWSDARSQAHPLFRKATAGAIDDSRVLDALRGPYLSWFTKDFICDDTLENPVTSLSQILKVPIVIDSRIALPTKPQGASIHNLDLSAFLLQTAQLHGVALDYRYGCIWITTPEDAVDWHDPTGIAALQPPPGSAIAAAWNNPLDINASQVELAKLLQIAIAAPADSFDYSAIPKSGLPVTLTAKNLSLRHALGIVLYHANCRCHQDGDKLIILPPEPR